jgi:hypothetical protein
MSDTPRTDAFAATAPGTWPISEVRWADFARRLERELAVMTAAKDRALNLAKMFAEYLRDTGQIGRAQWIEARLAELETT